MKKELKKIRRLLEQILAELKEDDESVPTIWPYTWPNTGGGWTITTDCGCDPNAVCNSTACPRRMVITNSENTTCCGGGCE